MKKNKPANKPEEKKDIFVGTDFYREKGLKRTVTVHLTEEVYEGLRLLAFKNKDSLQGIVRQLIEEKLKQ